MSLGKLSSLVSIRGKTNELLYQAPENTLTKGEVYINNKDSFPVRVRVGLSASGTVITSQSNLTGNITTAGSGYTQGIYYLIQLLNKPTQTFVVTTTSNPGTPPPNNVYVIDGDTQKELTLIKGNTYRFDLSDSSNSGHPLIFQTTAGAFLSSQNYETVSKGTPGQPGAFVDFIIKPSAGTETIKYNCQVHNGMGANISIIEGTAGFYGTNASASITVNSSGVISNVEFTSSGSDYKENDILQVYNGDVGGTGSGFEFTISNSVSTPVYTEDSGLLNSSEYVIYNLELNPGQSYKSNTLYFKDGQSVIVYGTSPNISFNLIGLTTNTYSTISGITTSHDVIQENTFVPIYEFSEDSSSTNISVCNRGTHQSKVNISIGDSIGDYIVYNHELTPNLQLDILDLKIGVNQKIFVKSNSALTNFVVYSE
jgi:hypothetical protein